MFKEGDKVKVIATGSIGTVNEIKNSNYLNILLMYDLG
jgi:hypothetical protein